MKKVLFAFAIVAFATACNSEGSDKAGSDTAAKAATDTAAKMDSGSKMAGDTTHHDTTKMATDTSKKK